MGMTNWMICGGVWMLCACGALVFMRGASLVNARAAELDDAQPELGTRLNAPSLRPALHASRSSLPRSAH
jgi:hypothetical protein